ncbi:MAG TPA: tetratricopeptide repeat protein, partial [Noviherbaspirillum sp.]|nr:tetratricopeptide repeat protein [Noviherbaspirillum sp.]
MQQFIGQSFARAVASHQRGDLAGAESIYRNILKRQPRHVASLGNLAALLLEQGQVEESEQLLRSAVRQFPKNASAWTTLSNLLYQRGDFDEAETAVREALKADSNYVTAWLNLGAILASSRKWKESLEASKVAMILQPDNPEAKQNAANAYLKLRELAAAEKLYREAIPIHPNQYRIFHDFAQFLKVSGRPHEAKEYFERAIAVVGNQLDSDILINYSSVLMAAGDQKGAIGALCRSIEIKPTENWFAWTDLLFNINYHPHLTERAVFEWYQRFGEEVERTVCGKMTSHQSWRWDGRRKLRIGYLSPDFKGHVCRF